MSSVIQSRVRRRGRFAAVVSFFPSLPAPTTHALSTTAQQHGRNGMIFLISQIFPQKLRRWNERAFGFTFRSKEERKNLVLIFLLRYGWDWSFLLSQSHAQEEACVSFLSHNKISFQNSNSHTLSPLPIVQTFSIFFFALRVLFYLTTAFPTDKAIETYIKNQKFRTLKISDILISDKI